MILSKDDRFLIVADSKCVIHVYDFQNYEKLSQINNLRNSEVSFMDMLIVDSSSFLVICTREHGLWVYRRELFDGTSLGMPFEKGSQLLLPFVHWSCCEISHKAGRINAIDSKGVLHSWGDIPELFEDKKLESESKIIFDSKYRPEIMLVNENLNLILLHNKNMHFFIKVESNTFQILEEQKYPKINPRMKERGVVVNHNAQFCMVAVNVEKKREGSVAELGLVKSTLFLYEYVSNSKVHLIAKVSVL
jgi:urease gamma subunit